MQNMNEQNNSEHPEVYALQKDKGKWQVSRRDFLKAAGIGAAVSGAGLISGCSREKTTGTDAADTAEPLSPGRSGNNDNRMEVTTKDPDTGESVTYTLPCDAAFPEGAVCTCNCISHRWDACLTHGYVTPTASVPNGNSGSGGSHYWHPN